MLVYVLVHLRAAECGQVRYSGVGKWTYFLIQMEYEHDTGEDDCRQYNCHSDPRDPLAWPEVQLTLPRATFSLDRRDDDDLIRSH